MSAEIAPLIPLRPAFDPDAPDAERRYDTVVARLNRLAAQRRRTAATCAELERQFVQNDLVAGRGARAGKPLTVRGRRRRLEELLAARAHLAELDRERMRWHGELDTMNAALDRWARKHFGMGGE